MAINTQGVTLKWGSAAGSLTKKIDVKDFPDLGGSPEMIETTTLSDPMQTFILGILSRLLRLTATTKSDFEVVNDDANTDLYYALNLAMLAASIEWQGQHSVRVTGASVNLLLRW